MWAVNHVRLVLIMMNIIVSYNQKIHCIRQHIIYQFIHKKTLVLCKTILFKGNNLSFEKNCSSMGQESRKIIILTNFSALKIVGVKVCPPHDHKFPHNILDMDMQMNSIGLIDIFC